MAGNTQSGTPFTGYLSLVNGAIGPTNIPIFTQPGNAAYTIQANDRLYVTSIVISSNDTAQALITVDSGGTTPTKFLSQYLSNTQPPGAVTSPWGMLRGVVGTLLRGTASAISAAKTVEITIAGTIVKVT